MPTAYRDYYAVLGVPRTATEKEVHSAFRKLARLHHPDVNPDDKSATDRFKEINEAHEVLGDPDKRRKYDDLGPRWREYEAWERAGKPGPNPFEGSGARYEYRTVSPEEFQDLFGDSAPFSDFFETFFGGSTSGFDARTTRRRARPAQRGGDIEGETEISLEEAFRGTTRTVELSSNGQPRRVEIRIPPGIHDGARIRAAGQGGAGQGGGPSGDLFVRVRIRSHPRFTRSGNELAVRVPVPLDVAIVGGAVHVSTLDGRRVELKVPPETQNGAKLRLRGQGMPHLRGGGAGDLIAEVDVRLPVPAPAELRQWAEKVSGATPAG